MKFHETNGDGVFDSCEHDTIKNLIEAIGDSKKTAKHRPHWRIYL